MDRTVSAHARTCDSEAPFPDGRHSSRPILRHAFLHSTSEVLTWRSNGIAPRSSTQADGGVYETAGGEAYVLEIAVPGLTTEEITIEATPTT